MEKATQQVRVFPSTYEKLRRLSFESRMSYPELIEAMVKLFEKQH